MNLLDRLFLGVWCSSRALRVSKLSFRLHFGSSVVDAEYHLTLQTEQKAQEESERLRQQEREAIAEKRRTDLVFLISHSKFERFFRFVRNADTLELLRSILHVN